MRRCPSWKAPGICQQDDDDVDCVVRYQLNQFEKTWSEAKSFCSSNGGKLASIVKPGDKLELLDDLSNQKISGFAMIGATSEDGKVWNWTDGSEIEEVKLESEISFGKAPFCIKIDKKGNWYKNSCSSMKEKFICEKEPRVVTGKKVVQLTYNSKSYPSSPFQLWYRSPAANHQLLNSWQEKKTSGFRISWSIRDQNGVPLQRNALTLSSIKPRFVDKKLSEMVRLARQGRMAKMTRDEMVEKAINEKKYWSKEGLDNDWKGVDVSKCSGGQIDLDQNNEIFSKITLGLKDITDDDGEPTEEDIATGFAIYSIVVFCSKEAELIQTLLTRLVSDETPGTLLKVVTNTLHSWKISLDMKKDLGKFYLALDRRLKLNVGKILLAASSSSQLGAMFDQDLPYLEPFAKETEECIKDGKCEGVTELVKSLGKAILISTIHFVNFVNQQPNMICCRSRGKRGEPPPTSLERRRGQCRPRCSHSLLRLCWQHDLHRGICLRP